MSKRKGVSVRQRRVSAELRSLRRERGLSCKDVAIGVDCSESKISRMETGDRGLYADDVATVLGFLQCPAAKRQELLALVREGEERNWHEIHGKLPTDWKDLIRFENEAAAIYNYEPILVPGLAQVADYSRTMMHQVNSRLSEVQVENLVAARMARQVIFSRRQAPAVHFIVDEMVLRRPVGGTTVMRAQLQHLLALTERPKATIQVAPFSTGAHAGLTGPFALLEFTENPTLAYVESIGTSSFLEEGEHVDRIKRTWSELRAIALSTEDSGRLIASILGELIPLEEREP